MTINNIEIFLEEHCVEKIDGIFMFETNDELKSFEDAYLSIRKKENRFLEIGAVMQLPFINKNHQHKTEWDIRACTGKRFRNYLLKIINTKYRNESAFTILDLGCGNGWLSNYLSELPIVNFVSVDINLEELKQAIKLQSHKGQLFVYADILKTKVMPDSSIDIVIMNSSFQYFQNFNILFAGLEALLKINYEIHILDTQFYNESHIKTAKERSSKYYSNNDESRMINYYYHHTLEELQNYDFDLMFNPNSILNRLLGKIKQTSPFPWIKISGKKENKSNSMFSLNDENLSQK